MNREMMKEIDNNIINKVLPGDTSDSESVTVREQG